MRGLEDVERIRSADVNGHHNGRAEGYGRLVGDFDTIIANDCAHLRPRLIASASRSNLAKQGRGPGRRVQRGLEGFPAFQIQFETLAVGESYCAPGETSFHPNGGSVENPKRGSAEYSREVFIPSRSYPHTRSSVNVLPIGTLELTNVPFHGTIMMDDQKLCRQGRSRGFCRVRSQGIGSPGSAARQSKTIGN